MCPFPSNSSCSPVTAWETHLSILVCGYIKPQHGFDPAICSLGRMVYSHMDITTRCLPWSGGACSCSPSKPMPAGLVGASKQYLYSDLQGLLTNCTVLMVQITKVFSLIAQFLGGVREEDSAGSSENVDYGMGKQSESDVSDFCKCDFDESHTKRGNKSMHILYLCSTLWEKQSTLASQNHFDLHFWHRKCAPYSDAFPWSCMDNTFSSTTLPMREHMLPLVLIY